VVVLVISLGVDQEITGVAWVIVKVEVAVLLRLLAEQVVESA
jgi:hypothetical protein